MAFIELTSVNTGEPVLFNVDNIVGVVKADDKTYVKSVGEDAVEVFESFSQVSILIQKTT